MRYTSAEANKLLKRLQEEKSNLVCKEEISRVFVAATIEDVEQARPDYNYEEVQAELVELDRKIRTVKHAINVFNTTHVVDGFDMTIDQLLVYLPQLSEMKSRLHSMAMELPKTRINDSLKTSLVEYSYANYDVAAVKAEYEKVADELNRAQVALDRLNTTETMEIDV